MNEWIDRFNLNLSERIVDLQIITSWWISPIGWQKMATLFKGHLWLSQKRHILCSEATCVVVWGKRSFDGNGGSSNEDNKLPFPLSSLLPVESLYNSLIWPRKSDNTSINGRWGSQTVAARSFGLLVANQRLRTEGLRCSTQWQHIFCCHSREDESWLLHTIAAVSGDKDG